METCTYMRWAWQPTQVFSLGESPWAEAADHIQDARCWGHRENKTASRNVYFISCHLRKRFCMEPKDHRLRALLLGAPCSAEADSERRILQPPRSIPADLWHISISVDCKSSCQQCHQVAEEAKAVTDWPDPRLVTLGSLDRVMTACWNV